MLNVNENNTFSFEGCEELFKGIEERAEKDRQEQKRIKRKLARLLRKYESYTTTELTSAFNKFSDEVAILNRGGVARSVSMEVIEDYEEVIIKMAGESEWGTPCSGLQIFFPRDNACFELSHEWAEYGLEEFCLISLRRHRW